MEWTHDFSDRYPSEYAVMLLDRFCDEKGVTSKGRLAAVVQLTRMASDCDFPLDPKALRTDNKGQVAGLSGAFIKKILAQHGIVAQLAREGGRTSRGNMGLAESYFALLNELASVGECDLLGIENYWIDHVHAFLSGKPFRLASDKSKTVTALVADLFDQVKKRQEENPGTHYLGTVLQHLVAAKLQLVMPAGSVDIHGAAVADAPTGRAGDFLVGDTVIHCTTAPGSPLLEKCAENIAAGYHPVIVTVQERVSMGAQLVADAGLGNSVDVWAVQQFLSTNVSERSLFDSGLRSQTLAQIIDHYNAIIDLAETDQSLKIDFIC